MNPISWEFGFQPAIAILAQVWLSASNFRAIRSQFSVFSMADPVPQPETLVVRFPFQADGTDLTLNSVVDGLNIGDLECDLNHYVLPTATPAFRMRPPSLDRLATAWIPWDTVLTPQCRYWLTFTDKDIYREATGLVRLNHGRFNWHGTATEWEQVTVELQLLNQVELLELQSTQRTAIDALQNQLVQKDAQVLALQQETQALRQQSAQQARDLTALQNRMGQVVEYLSARDDTAAVLFQLRQ